MFGTVVEEEPLQSPTKGILMTPGTAAARRKTVSFGDGVVDNEGKRAGRSGLPDDCPGKFPSPFVKSTADELSSSEKPRGRSKLTEALEQAREESAKRKSRTADKAIKASDKVEVFIESSQANSEAGKDWKLEYDQYRERTERELRKVMVKQRAAKSFARDKDTQCTELEEVLRQEMENTSRLEARLRLMEEKLRAANAEKDTALEDLARLKRSFDSSGYRRTGKIESETLKMRRSQEQMEGRSKLQYGANDSSTIAVPSRHVRPQIRDLQTKPIADDDDDSPPALVSSSLSQSKTTPSPTSSKANRSKAPEHPPNPLESLTVNTLPRDTLSVALSMGLQPPSPERESRSDSPMRSPQLKPQGLPPTPPAKDEVPKTSKSERPNVLTGSPVPVRSTIRTARSLPPTKENVAPVVPAVEESIKPSAAWARISTPAVERAKLPVVTAVVVDEGNNKAELDRQAAARARMMARVSSR
jgi:hypothetical protein